MGVLHLYQRPYASGEAHDRHRRRVILLAARCPLFPLLALPVRGTTGPVLLRQTRVGEHGEIFMMYKFRTMRSRRRGARRGGLGDQGRSARHRRRQVMRPLRLDELPQIWNVLIGDMSIVGPRPERPEFIDQLLESVPFWARRHLVKPGITGWAQINRGYTADTKGSLEKLSYDLWYIRHRSLTTDTRDLRADARSGPPWRSAVSAPRVDA